MTLRTLCSCFAVAAALSTSFACDKKVPDEGSGTASRVEATEKAAVAPVGGKFSLEALRVTASQTTYTAEGAPKPDEVKERLQQALYASDAFDEGGDRELVGTLMYDVRNEDGVWDVTLFGGLTSPNAEFEAGSQLRSDDEAFANKPLRDLVEEATDRVAKKLIAQAAVLTAGVDELVAILESPDAADEARLKAIQEIREREAKEAIPAVRSQLTAEHRSELRTAAAATLVQLGDTESSSEIIKVAEDLSRDRDPQYVPMLHVLADLGGTEAVTYLEAVAQGHSAPAVREVAAEALKTARKQQ